MFNKKYRDHLEELIEERTNELKTAHDQLKQESRMRKQFEAALRAMEIEIKEKQRRLEDMNSALRVLLNQRDEGRITTEEAIMSNIKSFVMPYLEKLKTSGLRNDQMMYYSQVELHLNDIASSYVKELSSEYINLSPSEIQVAALIKEGKCSKDIANLLGISVYTVMTHRYHIRKKIGLKGKDTNLTTYLQTLK